MTAPALPGAAPDPDRLPPEVERAIGKCCDAHGAYATARERGTIPQIDKAFKAAESAEAALRTAIARALGGDGEPVAWGLTDGKAGQVLEPLFTNVSAAEAAARRTGFLTVVPLYTRHAATGDTGAVEKAARTAALYVDEAWRKGAPKSEWHPIKSMLMRDAIRAATGDHPSEARRGQGAAGDQGGPDAR